MSRTGPRVSKVGAIPAVRRFFGVRTLDSRGFVTAYLACRSAVTSWQVL